MHSYLFYAFAFLFVLSLIGLFGVALNIITRRGLMPGLLDRLSGLQTRRRLAIAEQLAIDPQHRLVLVRSDQKEFLILIGREHNLLIDSGPAQSRDTPYLTAAALEGQGAAAPAQSPTPISRIRTP